MYGKIFESMYDGTLYGQWEAIITFQQMIVLADKEGFVDITPPALAARTSIPLEIIQKGIEILESEDPYSRTSGQNGKRIELITDDRPWGWQIVNYKKYRDMASREDKLRNDRERMAEKRAKEKGNKNKGVANSRNESQRVAKVAYVDVDTDVNKDSMQKPILSIVLKNTTEYPIFQTDIDAYQQFYPNIDVPFELKKCQGWNYSNPMKRKTKVGMKRHINGWLSRAAADAPPKQAPPKETGEIAYAD